MEKKILKYEKFIEVEALKDLNPEEKANLRAYHREMMTNFQHERLLHLIITLFFAAFTIAMIAAAGWITAINNFSLWMIPLYVLAAVLSILTFFYIKHYYFLENHIQGLYKYTDLLRR